MPFGKALGSAKLKITSMTVTPGPNKGRTFQMNCEGTGGESTATPATVVGTLTAVGDLNAIHGTWTCCGSSFTMDDSPPLNHEGGGTWKRLAPGKLHFHGTETFSDGQTIGQEIIGELAMRTLRSTTGKSLQTVAP